MREYTYEKDTRANALETYEWDNIWWEHAATVGVPRVLYIGDSISCGARRVATSEAKDTIFFDGFGTSKAVDNPYFADSVRLVAAQQPARHAVLFNNGLHGMHLEDAAGYGQAYEKLLCILLDTFRGTPLALLLTTHVADPVREQRVCARNRVVCALAEKYGLPVIDLYTPTKEHAELLSADGVHFTDEGYRLIAQELVKRVREWI